MSSDNNNNGQNSNNRRSRFIKVSEEDAIYNTFINVIRFKFSSMTRRYESPTNDPMNDEELEQRLLRLDQLYSSPEYYKEKKLLNGLNNNGLYKGLLSGLGVFVILRSSPRLLPRLINQKNNAQVYKSQTSAMVRKNVGGYTFDNFSPSNLVKGQRKVPFFFRVIGFGIDLTLSLYMAAWATTHFVDKKKLRKELSSIPLVEGRSIVSDELCTDFIDVYRGIPKKTWEKYEKEELDGSLERDASDRVENLNAIGSFVKNCIRRRTREREIIEENKNFGIVGDDSQDPDHPSIPSPGVSPDISVEIEWGDKSDEILVGKERNLDDGVFGNDEFYFGHEADSFPTDSENDFKRDSNNHRKRSDW